MHDPNENEPPCCAVCQQPLSEREGGICLASPQRFNGLLLCFEHQRRFSACPSVRGNLGR